MVLFPIQIWAKLQPSDRWPHIWLLNIVVHKWAHVWLNDSKLFVSFSCKTSVVNHQSFPTVLDCWFEVFLLTYFGFLQTWHSALWVNVSTLVSFGKTCRAAIISLDKKRFSFGNSFKQAKPVQSSNCSVITFNLLTEPCRVWGVGGFGNLYILWALQFGFCVDLGHTQLGRLASVLKVFSLVINHFTVEWGTPNYWENTFNCSQIDRCEQLLH